MERKLYRPTLDNSGGKFGNKSETSKYDSLPTTIEIAREGMATLQRLQPSLPAWAQEGMFYANDGVIRCFVGTNPVLNANHYPVPSKKRAQIKDILAKETEDFVIITRKSKGGTKILDTFLVNVQAASRVIQTHTKYFPDKAQEHPLEWIQNNTKEWYWNFTDKNLGDIRYGLLSGYPVGSVLQYHDFQEAIETVLQSPQLSQVASKFFYQFSQGRMPITQDTQQKVNSIVAAVPDIAEEYKALLRVPKESLVLNSPVIGQFFTFQRERDLQYIHALEDIFQQSGVKVI